MNNTGFWITAWPALAGLIVGIVLGILIRHFLDPLIEYLKARRTRKW